MSQEFFSPNTNKRVLDLNPPFPEQKRSRVLPNANIVDWFRKYVSIQQLAPFFVITFQKFAELLEVRETTLRVSIQNLGMGFSWPNRQLIAEEAIRARPDRRGVMALEGVTTAEKIKSLCDAYGFTRTDLVLNSDNFIVKNFGLGATEIAFVEEKRKSLCKNKITFLNQCFPKKRDELNNQNEEVARNLLRLGC